MYHQRLQWEHDRTNDTCRCDQLRPDHASRFLYKTGKEVARVGHALACTNGECFEKRHVKNRHSLYYSIFSASCVRDGKAPRPSDSAVNRRAQARRPV